MTARLARLTVSVSNLPRALRLYESVLGLKRVYAMGELVMLTTEDPTIELLLHQRPPSPSDAGVAASFAVHDVDAVTKAAAAAGATVVDEPADQPWGERQSVLRDADGHLLCLVNARPAEEPA